MLLAAYEERLLIMCEQLLMLIKSDNNDRIAKWSFTTDERVLHERWKERTSDHARAVCKNVSIYED